MKRIILAACLLVSGCSGNKSAELQKQLEAQQAQIKQLELQIEGLKSEHQKAMDGKLAEVQKYARQVGTSQKELLRLQRSHQQQIDALRDELAQMQDKLTPAASPVAPAEAAAAPEAKITGYTAPISVYSQPDPAASDFLAPPAGTNKDLFPVSVSEVRGVKVVSGSYTTIQAVPTDETYEDEFGETVAKTKMAEVTVPEYDYQVAFSAQNLTRTPKNLAAGAGRKTKTITLQAGEISTNLFVDSAFGADLTVRIGGTVRRFPVTYEE